MSTTPSRDTVLCISLAGRPGTFGVRFHNHLYRQLGLDFYYKAMRTDDLPAAVAGIRALGIRGCGVSMPYKEACMALVDEIDPSAAAIESVNTLVNTDGHLKAYNTDYLAVRQFWRSIRSIRAPPLPCVAVVGWPRPWPVPCVMPALQKASSLRATSRPVGNWRMCAAIDGWRSWATSARRCW